MFFYFVQRLYWQGIQGIGTFIAYCSNFQERVLKYRTKSKEVEAFRYGIEEVPEWAIGKITERGILDGKYQLFLGYYVVYQNEKIFPMNAVQFGNKYEKSE